MILFSAVLLLSVLILGGGRLFPSFGQQFRLFRILFPSWRFFESVTPIPKVHYRLYSEDEVISEWRPLLTDHPRKLSHLFFNEAGNLRLTYYGQLEQLLNDVAAFDEPSTEDIANLTSYKIVSQWIYQEVSALHPEAFEHLQFKVSIVDFSQGESNHKPILQECLISEPLLRVRS